jgi:hypothetical protein
MQRSSRIELSPGKPLLRSHVAKSLTSALVKALTKNQRKWPSNVPNAMSWIHQISCSINYINASYGLTI